jgi:hypothetical protein
VICKQIKKKNEEKDQIINKEKERSQVEAHDEIKINFLNYLATSISQPICGENMLSQPHDFASLIGILPLT